MEASRKIIIEYPKTQPKKSFSSKENDIERIYICCVCKLGFEKVLCCSKCKNAFYCGVICQKKDWHEHKKTCTVTYKEHITKGFEILQELSKFQPFVEFVYALTYFWSDLNLALKDNWIVHVKVLENSENLYLSKYDEESSFVPMEKLNELSTLGEYGVVMTYVSKDGNHSNIISTKMRSMLKCFAECWYSGKFESSLRKDFEFYAIRYNIKKNKFVPKIIFKVH